MGYPNVWQYNKEAKRLGLPQISPWEHNQVMSYSGGFRDTQRSEKIRQQAGIPTNIRKAGGVGYWLPMLPTGGGDTGYIPPEYGGWQPFQIPEALSMDIPGINQSTPSPVGQLDVLGVRSKKSRGTSGLRNPFQLSASNVASLKSGAQRAGLNLPI